MGIERVSAVESHRAGGPWGAGVSAGAGFGALWAGLYWRGDVRYALGIFLAHVIAGMSLGVAARVFESSGRRFPLAPLGIVGFAFGGLWLAPYLLFVIDEGWLDITASASGIAIATLSVSTLAVAGALLGNRFDRSSFTVRTSLVVLLVLLAPLSLRWQSPPRAGPRITISDRIDGAPVAPRDGGPRVMVLGIDGGTWDVLGPLVRAGKLPNLKSLMDSGWYGVLNSVAASSGDTASPVVWTSIFSGVGPQEHGIRDWLSSDSRNRVRKSLWNILNGFGEKTILVNIPGSFPPERVLGAMISGFPIPSLVRASSTRFQVSEGRIYGGDERRDGIVPTTRIVLHEREDFEGAPHSFSTLLETELPLTETLEAKYGNLRHPAHRLGFGNLFLELIERRGFFQARVLARYRLVLADGSDDGVANHDEAWIFDGKRSGSVGVVRAGGWSDWISLRVRGVELRFKLRWLDGSETGIAFYATPLFQSSPDAVIPFTYPPGLGSDLSTALSQYTVEGAGWTVYQDERMLDPLYEHLIDVSEQHLAASKLLLEKVPDWSLFVHVFTESDRIQHAFWPFHQPEPYPSLDPRLVARHRDKVRSVHERIDADIGDLLRYRTEDTVVLVLSDHGFGPAPSVARGAHTMDGVYVLSGKGVVPSDLRPDIDEATLPRASVLDITPTILHLMGYPVGKDMEGRLLLESEGRDCCPVSFIESYETGREGGETPEPITIDETTLQQLKSLGYVK